MKKNVYFLILSTILMCSACYNEAIPCFSIQEKEPKTDSTLHFINCSTDAEAFAWDFGDSYQSNYSSSEKNPTHVYLNNGDYTVTLMAWSKKAYKGQAVPKVKKRQKTIHVSNYCLANFYLADKKYRYAIVTIDWAATGFIYGSVHTYTCTDTLGKFQIPLSEGKHYYEVAAYDSTGNARHFTNYFFSGRGCTYIRADY